MKCLLRQQDTKEHLNHIGVPKSELAGCQDWGEEGEVRRRKGVRLRGPACGRFFCPEIRAFTGFGARFLRPFPKSLATVKYYQKQQWPLIAVNCL